MTRAVALVALLALAACAERPTSPSAFTPAPAVAVLNPADANVVVNDPFAPVTVQMGRTLGLFRVSSESALTIDSTKLRLVDETALGWVVLAYNTGPTTIVMSTPSGQFGQVEAISISVTISR